MLTRESVMVVVSPGILRNRAFLQIGTIPARVCPWRGLHQRYEPFLNGWVTSHLEPVQVERRPQVLDLQVRGLGFGGAEVFHHLRSDQSRQQSEYHQHHQQFYQGKALGLVACLHLPHSAHVHSIYDNVDWLQRQVVNAQNRNQDRHDDPPNNNPEPDNQHWLQQGQHTLHRGSHLTIINIGQALQHRIQTASLLSHPDKVNGERRETSTVRQPGSQGSAPFNTLRHRCNTLLQYLV